MDGAICKREILSHPVVTIECFGWAVFFRAVFSGRDQTFLSLLQQAGVFQRPRVPVSESTRKEGRGWTSALHSTFDS